jgi:hypothetical protein
VLSVLPYTDSDYLPLVSSNSTTVFFLLLLLKYDEAAGLSEDRGIET